VQRAPSRRTRPADPASRCRWWSRVSPETRGSMRGVHDMVLKGFSYAMIGAFLSGLAMTVGGSAGVLMGF